MKKLTKSVGIAALLVASLVALNQTNAQLWGNGIVQLEITAADATCEYGKNVDFGSTGTSYNAITFQKGFDNGTTGFTTNRSCNDTEWDASWSMTLASSDVLNMDTSDAAHTIPSTQVSAIITNGAVTAGDCVIANDTAATDLSLDTPRTILSKTAALWDICEVTNAGVELKLVTNANQAIGAYSGDLTIDITAELGNGNMD